MRSGADPEKVSFQTSLLLPTNAHGLRTLELSLLAELRNIHAVSESGWFEKQGDEGPSADDAKTGAASKPRRLLKNPRMAKAGSLKGQALIVGVGTNVNTLSDALRKNGIYVEGPIRVPVAAAPEGEPEAAPAGA